MSVNLPDLGRGGIINAVRKVWGNFYNPSRLVSTTADFIAGMVAELSTDSNGNPEVIVANASTANPLGLFFCHKTTSFYRPIIDEEQTFGTSPNTATYAYLNHANMKSSTGYLKVTNSSGTPYTNGVDFTVSATNGYIKRNGAGISSTGTIYVSYLYLDPNQTGIDQTLGSGQAAMLEGSGEIATLVYDAGKTFSLNGLVYVNALGMLTNTGTYSIGVVTKVPSADDPELGVKITL